MTRCCVVLHGVVRNYGSPLREMQRSKAYPTVRLATVDVALLHGVNASYCTRMADTLWHVLVASSQGAGPGKWSDPDLRQPTNFPSAALAALPHRLAPGC